MTLFSLGCFQEDLSAELGSKMSVIETNEAEFAKSLPENIEKDLSKIPVRKSQALPISFIDSLEKSISSQLENKKVSLKSPRPYTERRKNSYVIDPSIPTRSKTLASTSPNSSSQNQEKSLSKPEEKTGLQNLDFLEKEVTKRMKQHCQECGAKFKCEDCSQPKKWTEIFFCGLKFKNRSKISKLSQNTKPSRPLSFGEFEKAFEN